MINYTLTPVVRTYAITGHAVVLKPFFVVAATRTYAFTGVANLWHAGSTLRGITIVSPIKDVLQGVVLSRNVFRGVTVSIGSGTGVLQLRVADNQNRPVQGATCRVLNLLTTAILSTSPVLSFDGTDDWAETGAFPDIGNFWTVEAWIMEPKIHVANTSIVGRFFNGSTLPFTLGYGTAFGNNNLRVGYFGGAWRNCFATQAVQQNTWTHVAGIRDGSILAIYINGVLSNQITVSPLNTPGTQPLRIARRWDDTLTPANMFGGQMSEVRIWSRARTQSEIVTGMYVRLAGNEPSLVAYYPMSQGSGAAATDIVAARNATINGATWQTVNDLPIGRILYDTATPYSTAASNAEGIATLSYVNNRTFGLEVTMPGKRRFIMPFNRDRIQYLDWQAVLNDHIATFLTDSGDLLINANPQDAENNFLLEI